MEPLKDIKISSISITLLFIIINIVIGQECRGKLDTHFLICERDHFLKVDSNFSNQEVYASSSPLVNSVDYDCKRNFLVWSDYETEQIYIILDNSTDAKVLVPKQKNWVPLSITVDPVSNKLYVADSFTDTIQIFDIDDVQKRGIIFGLNLTKVKGINLDLYEGYLFILDQNQILRTDLDGSHPKVLYFESDYGIEYDGEVLTTRKPLNFANLALDTKTKHLYWINYNSKTIESLDYHGNNRKIHYRDESLFEDQLMYTLSFLNSNLYWTDLMSGQVFEFDLKKEKIEVAMQNVNALIIKAIDCQSQQTVINSCEKNNGQCQHFCLLSRSSKDNVKCSCKIGYELDKDGKSCVKPRTFLLFQQDKFVRGKSLNNSGYIFADVIDPSKFEVDALMGLDFDAAERIIFYSDGLKPEKQLRQIGLDDGKVQSLSPNFLCNFVGQITYDWITKNLYYFSHYYSDTIILSVVNRKNPQYSKNLIEIVNGSVRGIVVHPTHGYIYFIQMNTDKHSICRINTDGSGLKILMNLDGENIKNGLAVDYNQNRLYWSELQQVRYNKWNIQIRHCDLDGEDVQNLIEFASFEGYLTTLVVYDEWLYLNTGSMIYRLDKNGKELITIFQNIKIPRSLYQIKVFNRTIQTNIHDHPCANNINHCQKFCFAIPDLGNRLKGICDCPYGEKLGQDGTSCVDNSREEPPFLPCADVRFQCSKRKARIS